MEELREILEDRIKQNPQFFYGNLTEEDKDHIIDISISIINTRDKTGPKAGHFVHSILDNNLEEAVRRADAICIRALPFFIDVKNNFNLNLKDTLRLLYNKATEITLSDKTWEEKYDLIFSADISERVYEITYIDYCDPDASYEEDVWAFMNAFKDKIN